MQSKFLGTLALLFIVGCISSSPKTTNPIIVSPQSLLQQGAVLDVREAFVNADKLFIHYQIYFHDNSYSQEFYGAVLWKNETNAVDLSQNLVVPIQNIETVSYHDQIKDLKPVNLLPDSFWKDFRQQLIHRLTPKEKDQAVSLRQGDKEFIIFYDDNEQIQIRDVAQKPLNVSIKETLNQEELSSRTVQAFNEFLKGSGIEDRQFLMTTFYEDDPSGIFLFIDLDQQMALSLKMQDASSRKYQESLIGKGMKSADYLVLNSHVLGIMKRPISSAFRLFQWTKDTAYDVINPDKIRILEQTPLPPLHSGEGMDLKEFEARLDKVTKTKLSKGTMRFFIGGDEFFPRLIEALLDAKESILFRIFIFDNDDYAVKIADILKEKSKTVDVKVLLDSMGQMMGEGAVPEGLPAGFIPPASMKDYLVKDSKIKVRVKPNAWFKADHTKTIIIDKEICFTGGMNIGREYRYDWHDLMIELQGGVLAEVRREFKHAWEHSSRMGDIAYMKSMLTKSYEKQKENGYPIRLLYTRADNPQIYRAQLEAIRFAKKYIYIHNAYFSDNAILYELIRARRRGVDVRVILPVNGNHAIMNESNIVTANIMFKNGIKVYFYPGMSHVKAAIYDGWLCSGSANFDKLSFKDNLELNVATSDAKTAEHLRQALFERDFKKSMVMTALLKSGLKESLAEFLAGQL